MYRTAFRASRNCSGSFRGRPLVVLPTTEQATDPFRLERESVANVFKSERPGHVGRLKPLGRLLKQLLTAHAPGVRAAAEGQNRIFEHGRHERQLWHPSRRTLEKLDELHGQEHFRNGAARITGIVHCQLSRSLHGSLHYLSSGGASAPVVRTRSSPGAGRACNMTALVMARGEASPRFVSLSA